MPSSYVPYYFKALQRYLLKGCDAGFLLRYGNLLPYGIYAVQIRQKETSPKSIRNNNPITLCVKIILGINVFRFTGSDEP